MQLIAVVHYGELTFLNARPGSKALKKDTDTLFFEECSLKMLFSGRVFQIDSEIPNNPCDLTLVPIYFVWRNNL